MIERKTSLQCIELNRDGSVGIKIAKLLVEDGVEIDCQWHRTLITPVIEPESQMAAVNEHLVQMGLPAVSAEEVARIKTHCDLFEARSTAREAFLEELAAAGAAAQEATTSEEK